ncbi:MAG: CvpA family protein [Alphaproteobacteria bacterium]|nr:CvpA family protein [Alphaproteobacteria bacterium]
MLELTTLDYIYVAIVVGSAIWATVRGGIYETIATISWIVAAIAARFVSPHLDKLLQQWFKLSESTVGTLVASYFIVFFVILVVIGFINQKIRDKIQNSVLSVTDKTLGVIFGLIRGIVVMGFVYWGLLWYYSDVPTGLPKWAADAKTRPVMQLTTVKLDEWFFFGNNKLVMRDMTGAKEAKKIYENLINPAVEKQKVKPESGGDDSETGYKTSERAALENQLLQIENVANAIQEKDNE